MVGTFEDGTFEKSTRDVAKHTLMTRNRPARGGSQFDDRKSTQDVAEHTLPTGNRPGRVGTHSAD